jgi:DHA1 family bicyclomycin/chloramphenicol resistance-like MFS transporter
VTPTTLLWLVTGCLMLQPLSTDLYLASLPHMASDFGVPPSSVQHTLSLFVVGFGTAQLISGPLSDRFGRRSIIVGGLTIYLLASIGCAISPDLNWLVASRFAQAIGCCTGVVVARAVVRDVYSPSDGARILAKASSLLSLAPILGPILGSYLQVSFGWRAAFVAHALVGLTVWIAALKYMTESNAQPNPRAMALGELGKAYAEVFRSLGFWAYALPGALSYASIFVFISGASFVLIKVLNVATEHYGYMFSLGVLGYLSGTLICRRLLNSHGIQGVLRLGTTVGLLGGIGFLALILADFHHWFVIVAALFVVMVAHGINIPCTQSGSLAPFPEKAGAAAALFGFVMMVVALIAGIVVSKNLDASLIPFASISATVAVLLFLSTRLLARHAEGL